MSLKGTGQWPNVVHAKATNSEIMNAVREDLLDQAVVLLREIADAGYIKTKHTSNETRLEERVDEFLKGIQ